VAPALIEDPVKVTPVRLLVLTVVTAGVITTLAPGETAVVSEVVETQNNVLSYVPAVGLVMPKTSTCANVLSATEHDAPRTTVTVCEPPVVAVAVQLGPAPLTVTVGFEGITKPAAKVT
jgi:hypothetical protein